MRIRVTLIALAMAAVATTALPDAQERRYFDKASFYDVETVSAPRISPDGATVIFSRGYIDVMADQNRSNLWVVNTDGTRLRQMTDGDWSDSSAVWSPDGQRIAFLSDRSGETQLHVMWADSREHLQLTRLPRPPGSITWSPDGRSIAYTSFVPDTSTILPVRLPPMPRGAQVAPRETVVDSASWARDGSGPSPRGFTHVFVIDAVVGGTPRQVTSGNYNHSGPAWSADGRTIYVSGIRKPDAEYAVGDSEVYAIDLATLDIRPMTDRNGPDNGPAPSPDGRWIAYTGYDQQQFTSHLSSLYLMDATGARKRLWVSNLPSSPSNVTWAPDGSGVYYSMEQEGEENTWFAPADQGLAPRRVTSGVHVLSTVSLARDGRAAGVLTSVTKPGVLVAFSTSNPGEMRELVDVNADVLADRVVADAEELRFKSADGLEVQGWLMKPANFDPSKKYPMVLWIHGGPWSMYDISFSWAYQNFAANGYAVLWTNPRGSTGYGQSFVNGIQYSYPGRDYEDLMAGVDAAIAKGFVDSQNLFVCGGSGGGVLTAWIVGHTDRFRAAVSMRPVINWHSFVGTTDGTGWYRQFEKYPWEDPADHFKRSPLSYVGNVTTPTMLMTGTADLRTPISQTEEYYRALKMVRKADTVMVRMPDEYHGWRRPSHRLLQQLYLLAWFEKYRTAESKRAVPAID